MSEPEASLVLARAKLNFARRCHGERCWDTAFRDGDVVDGNKRLPLSPEEQEEFLAQARHELRREPAP